MKQQITSLLILSLFIATLNSTPITDCTSSATDITIKVGTTTGVNSWDDVVTCIANLQSAEESITALTIIIDGNVTTKTNSLDLVNNNKFDNYNLDIQIQNSDLTSDNLSNLLFYPIQEDIDRILQIKLTIDIPPETYYLTSIKNWYTDEKLDLSSVIKIYPNDSESCNLQNHNNFDDCLMHIADETAVKNCDNSFLDYIYLTLVSTVPSEVNSCLSIIDNSGGSLERLNIDYTGATTVAAENLDFDTLLTNRKTFINNLSVNLKSTNYKDVPVITSVFSNLIYLKLNYSNNGLTATEIKTLAENLVTVKSVAQDTFDLIITDSSNDTNKVGNFYHLKNNLIGQNIDSGPIVYIYLTQQNNICYISNYFNDEFSMCSLQSIQIEEISKLTKMNCNNQKMEIFVSKYIEGNVEDAKVTGNLIVNPSISAWDTILSGINNLEDNILLPIYDLDIGTIYKIEFQVTSFQINNQDVLYNSESFEFEIQQCKPQAQILINGKKNIYSFYNCEDYLFSIDENNITENAQITSETSFQWALTKDDQNFTINDEQNMQGRSLNLKQLEEVNYKVSLTISNPDILVQDFEFQIRDVCPAYIYIDGVAPQETYSNCKDLQLSVGSYPDGIVPDSNTSYQWFLEEYNSDQLNNLLKNVDNLNYQLSEITIPKSILQKEGKYVLGLDLNIVTVQPVLFEIVFENCDGGGSGGQNGGGAGGQNGGGAGGQNGGGGGENDENKQDNKSIFLNYDIIIFLILLTIY